MPWAMVTGPVRPGLRPAIGGLSGGGSQVHSAPAPAPALTLPGSLSFARGVLVLISAVVILLSPQYKDGADDVSNPVHIR